MTEITEEILVPICIEGERNCPPEDCGSIPGYQDIIEALKKPKAKKNIELIEWLGDDYDPDLFDIESVNKCLRPKKAMKKKRK